MYIYIYNSIYLYVHIYIHIQKYILCIYMSLVTYVYIYIYEAGAGWQVCWRRAAGERAGRRAASGWQAGSGRGAGCRAIQYSMGFAYPCTVCDVSKAVDDNKMGLSHLAQLIICFVGGFVEWVMLRVLNCMVCMSRYICVDKYIYTNIMYMFTVYIHGQVRIILF